MLLTGIEIKTKKSWLLKKSSNNNWNKYRYKYSQVLLVIAYNCSHGTR